MPDAWSRSVPASRPFDDWDSLAVVEVCSPRPSDHVIGVHISSSLDAPKYHLDTALLVWPKCALSKPANSHDDDDDNDNDLAVSVVPSALAVASVLILCASLRLSASLPLCPLCPLCPLGP